MAVGTVVGSCCYGYGLAAPDAWAGLIGALLLSGVVAALYRLI
jgi:hypothetical protein